jgi:branched-chain amino acid transport system substrate-binding protein
MSTMRKGFFWVSCLVMAFLIIGIVYEHAYSTEEVAPIVIGVPLPRAAVYGQDAERGMILAVEEINAAGGVNVGGQKRPFKLEIADTRDQEPGVPTTDVLLAIEKLILDKKVDVLAGGPVMSESSLAALDLFPKYKKVDIVNTGTWTPAWHAKTASDIEKYKYSFKVTEHAVLVVGNYLGLLGEIKKAFGFDKIYISIAEAAHCKAAAAAIEKVAPKFGYKIVGKDVHPLGTTDFFMMLRDVKKSGAQVLFIWDHTDGAINMLKQWHDLKIPALPLGFTDGTNAPDMWEQTQGKVANTIMSAAAGGALPGQSFTKTTQTFFESFKKRWGMEPRSGSNSCGYASVYLLKDAIERAGSVESDALVTALEKTEMTTPAGMLKFDKASHQAVYGPDPDQAMVTTLFQWQDGKRVAIWPRKAATGKEKLPPWMEK